ncbi:MAG: TetR/AcrR family transcriptional regulator [Rectinemataceae bacterium]
MTMTIKDLHDVKPFSKAKFAVVRAAAQAVREDGPRAATLKNVAGRAGITEPAIFRHFDGVDGLFEGLFHVVEGAWRHFAEAFDPAAAPLARLGKALKYRIELLSADLDLAYLALYPRQVFGGYPELRARIDSIWEQDRVLVEACLTEAITSGALRGEVDMESLRALTVGACQSLAIRWVESTGSFDLVKTFDTLWEDFLKLATPASRKRAATKA